MRPNLPGVSLAAPHFISDTDRAQYERQRLFFLYCGAVDRCDYDEASKILDLAATDLQLSEMIWEWHIAEAASVEALENAQTALEVCEILQESFPSAVVTSSPDEALQDDPTRPLTVAEVAARLQADAAQGQLSPQQQRHLDHGVLQRLRQLTEPLPNVVNGKWVRDFFARMGTPVSSSFESMFRETAVLLNMGRQQNTVHLAAMRRHHMASPAPARRAPAPAPAPAAAMPPAPVAESDNEPSHPNASPAEDAE